MFIILFRTCNNEKHLINTSSYFNDLEIQSPTCYLLSQRRKLFLIKTKWQSELKSFQRYFSYKRKENGRKTASNLDVHRLVYLLKLIHSFPFVIYKKNFLPSKLL